jgi:hypothetical protein
MIELKVINKEFSQSYYVSKYQYSGRLMVFHLGI